MAEQYKNFMQIFWFQREDNIYTVGFNEDALEGFESIESIELPAENESTEAEVVCGSLETDKGPIDIYTPVSGTITEINNTILEDPSLIQDDPYDAWLFKVESTEDFADDDEEDEEWDEDDEDEDDLDEEESEDEEEDRDR
jgi:glycine cleavage system H protein